MALKILPEAFAGDPDRLARFQREAQVLASLNNPNIAQIHGIEESDGTCALVLELVEGPTLADRIAQGPIPIDEALPIAKQIAEALEAAHEAGVIHRDLKPANIKVKDDRTVKVLDFGLAKALDTTPQGDPSQSPTLTAAATQMGVIMGTAAYMSPEQARGGAVDRRTDVWAFGAVVYEILVGRRAFAGDDVSETIVSVLRDDPDWAALPRDVPSRVRQTLRVCLDRDRSRRVPDIVAIRLAMEGSFEAPPPEPDLVPSAVGLWRQVLPGIVGLFVGGAVVGTFLMVQAPLGTPRVTRFTIGSTDLEPMRAISQTALAVSPDGGHIVYRARTGTDAQLVARPIDSLETIPIPGSEDAVSAFFSPDGAWLGFYGLSGELHRVALGGGSPERVYEPVDRLSGATWGEGDRLVFSAGGALYSLTLNQPAAELLVEGEASEGRFDPEVLPGGGIVYTVSSGGTLNRDIAAYSPSTGEERVVLRGASSPQYVQTGHLLFIRDDQLMATAFDVEGLEAVGLPVAVRVQLQSSIAGAAGQYAVSASGTLVYRTDEAGLGETRLVWRDRDGGVEEIASDLLSARYPRLSPDGGRLAATVGPAGEGDIWIFDLTSGSQPVQITFEGHDIFPVWRPDGRRVTFASVRDSDPDLYDVPADGSETVATPLLMRAGTQRALQWFPDGNRLLFEDNTSGDMDIRVFMEDTKEIEDWIGAEFTEISGRLSPDGSLVAYQADRSLAHNVWLRRYPDGAPVRVSPDGGLDPVWSSNGTELFYQNEGKLVSVRVDAANVRPRLNPPEVVFDGGFAEATLGNIPRTYDVASDSRFLMIQTVGPRPAAELVVVQNWAEELKRLVPVD